MALKFAILGILADFGPQSGYDVKSMFEQGPSHVWTADLSQIYRTLSNLVSEQFVKVEEDTDSARGRKVYSITSEGVAALKNWLSEDYEILPVREPGLLRLYFSSHIPPKRVKEQLRTLKSQLEVSHAEYISMTDAIQHGAQYKPQAAIYWQFTLDMGLQWLQAYIDWCEKTLEKLEELDQ
ncbi:MAG: PadR family transcriptional regulator [Anaerolineales bacterium]|nr:PadR family transcriptional regulator [Anaerolineales bacterium]